MKYGNVLRAAVLTAGIFCSSAFAVLGGEWADFNPSPENGRIDVPINTQLSWDVRGDCWQTSGLVNGDFETGTFTGWTLVNSANSGTFVINNGGFDPASPDGPLPAYNGYYSAMSNQTIPGTRTIYQEVVLPSNATSLTLRWADMIRNHAAYFMDPKQEYRVEVRDLNNQVLATLFSTNPGDLLKTGWMERSADIIAFAGRTVRIAFTQEDNYGFFNVHIDNVRIESEIPPVNPVVYEVYLGTDPSDMKLAASDLEEPVYNPCLLDYETTYYWQVIAKNDCGQNSSPICSFGTQAWQPQPENGAKDVPVDTLLEWNDGNDSNPPTGVVSGVVNGDFETGTFAGWTLVNSNSNGTFVINNGRFDPFSPDGPLPVYNGSYSAMSNQSNPGIHTIYQEVVVPSNAISLKLRWADMIRNHAASFEDPKQEYRVEVRDLNNQVLATLFSTNRGDLLKTGWIERSADILSFAGRTVRIAFTQEDTYGFFNVHIDNVRIESEIPPVNPVVYDVYLGTDPSDMKLAASNLEEPVYNPCLLDYETTYYWQVIAKNDCGQSSSPICSFDTQAWLPQPENGVKDVPVNTLLEWSGCNAPNSSVEVVSGVVNGDFETGTFAGWTLVNSTNSGTFVINNGGFEPPGPDGPLPAYSGSYSAMSNQVNLGIHTIYQEVVLPSNATSLTLRWADMIRNHATRFEDPKQEYRVEIRTPDNQVLATLFSTNPGDTLKTGWMERSADILAFAGRTVRVAFTQEDTYGFFNVHIDNVRIESEIQPVNLIVYDVYLGTDPSDMKLAASNLEEPVCAAVSDPNNLLLRGRIYYWQVVARNNCGETISPIWSFSTENTVPVADAGADQTVYAWVDNNAQVQLDGSGSSDADGNALTYQWMLNGQIVSTESKPMLTLASGVHTISLVVSDGLAESAADEVVIAVVAPVAGELKVVPRVINRKSQTPQIAAILTLPAGVGAVEGALAAYPGGKPVIRQQSIGQGKMILCWIDKDALLSAIADNGTVEILLVGKLADGRTIYGKDRVTIMK